MFYDKHKHKGIVIGPLKPDNPKGDYLCVRVDNLAFFKIHATELLKQIKIPVTLKQTESRDRFLGFEKSSGDLVIATRKNKYLANCIIIDSEVGILKWQQFVLSMSNIDRAPSSFYCRINRIVKLPDPIEGELKR